MLAVPLAGPVKITVKDLNGKIFGETTATPQGEWRQTFCLDNGTYIVEFTGRFRPIGKGFKAIYNNSITSTSITIVVPLVATPDPLPPIGPPGPTGPRGPVGVQGESGPSGSSGPAGPQGPSGSSGPSGAAGPQGIPGTQGGRGDMGPQGLRGLVGPDGPPGATGATGATGPAGPVGDSCDINIGTPEDGYLSDGLLAWEPDTKVCEALDDVNEILAQLAPAQPLSLAGTTLTMTGVAMYNGNASDKAGQNYKSVAGESIGGTYLGGSITLSDAFTLKNPTIGDPEAGGDDTFYPGNEGILSSRITTDGAEYEMGSIDLISAYPNPDLSLTLNSQNSGYNSFNLWVRGDASISVSTYLESGYNKIIMRHTVSGTDRDSEEYEVFYDDSGVGSSFDVNPSSIELSAVIRELSGIRNYNTGSTWRITANINASVFKNVYQTNAFTWTLTSTVGGTISLTDPAWDGTVSSPPNVLDSPVLGGTTNFVATTLANIRSVSMTTGITINKPGRSANQVTIFSPNKLIDSFSDSSTVLNEPFDDENYRLPDNDGNAYPDNYDTVPVSLTGNWTSESDLIDGEAAVFHGSLYHGSSSSLPSGGNFSTMSPSGSPDYSGFTSDAVYLRAFKDAGNPHNNGILELVGLTSSDVSPVGSGDVNVEIKLPTETGWLDLGKIFNVATFTGIDGDGCQTAQSGDDWSFTFSTFSTADSDFTIIVRVTIRNTTSVISRMRITNW